MLWHGALQQQAITSPMMMNKICDTDTSWCDSPSLCLTHGSLKNMATNV